MRRYCLLTFCIACLVYQVRSQTYVNENYVLRASAGGVYELFYNGNLVSSVNSNAYTSSPLLVGSAYNATYAGLHGVVSDVQTYDFALSDSLISDLSTNVTTSCPIASPPPPLPPAPSPPPPSPVQKRTKFVCGPFNTSTPVNCSIPMCPGQVIMVDQCNLPSNQNNDGLGNDEVFYSGNDATVVAAALRASPTLTSLEFKHAGLGHTAAASKTAVVLLGALVGHRTLRSLTLGGDMVFRGKVARKLGAALAAVVAADAPAFTKLDVRGPFHIRQRLDQYLLAPVLAALPHNHHLRKLDLSYNHMSEAFAREQLLPAARSNTSLRELFLCGPDDGVARPLSAAAEEAKELVRSRAR